MRWLGETWDRLWRSLSKRVHFSGPGQGIGWTLLAVVAFVLSWIAVRLLVNLQLVRSRTPRRASAPGSARSARALSKGARVCKPRRVRAAALLLFAATVALLDLRGAVCAERTRRGRFARELRSNGTHLSSTVFDAVAGPFVQTAYAERAVDAAHGQGGERGYSSLSEASQLGLAGLTNERVGGDGTT